MSRLVRKAAGEWDLVRKAGGGLNKLADPYEVPDGECSELINFVFLPDAWKKRNGCVRKIKIPGETKITRLYLTNFTNETNYLLAFAGTAIYKIDLDAWTAEALTVDVTLTTGKRFDVVQMGDVIYLVNGTDVPLKWIGGTANVQRMGIAAPAAGTGAFGSTGLCTAGEHGIRISWYNEDAGTESNYYDVGTDTSSGSDKLQLSAVTDSTDDQVTHLRIYMTKADDATGTFYLAAEVAIGGTYAASISDDDLAAKAAMQVVVDEQNADVPPTKAKYIATGKQRLFLGYIYRDSAWRSDELAWSEQVGLNVTEPEYFATLNWRKALPHGGKITRLIMWGDYLYILHEKGVCVMTDPSSPDTSPIQEMMHMTGCTAPWSAAVGKFQRKVPAPPELRTEEYELVDGIIYKGKWGVMAFDGQHEYPLSEKLEPLINAMAPTAEDDMIGFFSKGKYYLAYGERYGAAGETQERREDTTDSDGEQSAAVIDVDQVEGIDYDAINLLDSASVADREIAVGVHVPLNNWWERYGEERSISATFTIYFSKDGGATWTAKLTKTVTNAGALNGTAQENYEYKFIDSSVDAVRLDYSQVEPETPQILIIMPSIRLDYVRYWYDPSATIVNNRLLYYDSLENKWSRFRGWNASAFEKLDVGTQDGGEYYGDSSDGCIFRMNEGYEDDGDSIFAQIVTGYTDGKFPEVRKRWIGSTLILAMGNSDLHYRGYVDRLEVLDRLVSLRMDGDREQYYDEIEYGEAYYNVHQGERQERVMFEPNVGFRMCEEIWVNNREDMIIRGRTAKFVKREN